MSTRHISARVIHNNGSEVVAASSKELCIGRYLYKTNDCSAAYNVGRVIAYRCKNAGLTRVTWEKKSGRNNGKV